MIDKDNIIATMKTDIGSHHSTETYYKLIALWAVCEAFAGGILHAVKMPFSGMILSSLAVMCITLIARYAPGRLHILKATFIVCIFKLMLSPHSPPTAYIAVGFQGLMGQILFLPGFSLISAVMLGFLALVESAIQKILVMIILYGVPFWEAVNEFLKKNFDPAHSHDYLYTLAILYVSLHALTGVLSGLFSAYLARNAEKWKGQYPHLMIKEYSEEEEEKKETGKARRKFKILYWIGWLFLLLLYVQAKTNPENAIMPVTKLTDVLIRAVLILAGWLLLISPILMRLLKKILSDGKKRMNREINQVLTLIPQTRHIFRESFRMSASVAGPERILIFFRILVINIMK